MTKKKEPLKIDSLGNGKQEISGPSPEEVKQDRIQKILDAKESRIGALDSIKRLQNYGFMADLDPKSDQEAQDMLDEVAQGAQAELDEMNLDDLAPLIEYEAGKYDESSKKKKYTVAEKAQAIFFMEIIQREAEVGKHAGDLVPDFKQVSIMLGVTRSSLELWWRSREKIINITDGISAKMEPYVKLKLEIELMRMTTAMSTMDYTKMPAKDFAAIFKLTLQQQRLISGKSTANTQVNHNHRGEVTIVPSDDIE